MLNSSLHLVSLVAAAVKTFVNLYSSSDCVSEQLNGHMLITYY